MKEEPIKYLYIFSGAIRNLTGFLKMVGNRADVDDHWFFLPRTDDIKAYVPELAAYSNIIYLPRGGLLKQLRFQRQLFKRTNHIIIHGMFFGAKPLMVLLSSKQYLQRLSWIEWTGDVYDWKRPGHSLKDRLINWVNRRIREEVGLIVMSAPTDEERFASEFDISNKKILNIAFPSVRDAVAEIESLRPALPPHPQECWIQVGHNAYSFHHHIHILDILARFKNENLKIITPMAYGDSGLNGQFGGRNYIRAVNRFAKLVFQEKAVPYFRSVPLRNYTKFLWNVDIAVFAMDRLAGASNVFMLLYMGKKVFFPGDSPHYRFFKDKGFDVYDTNEIPNMTFEEFIRPVQNHDISWLRNVYDNETTIQNWQEFYRELELREKNF